MMYVDGMKAISVKVINMVNKIIMFHFWCLAVWGMCVYPVATFLILAPPMILFPVSWHGRKLRPGIRIKGINV